ncbi:MAG: PTS sugar transporter subunit IIA [Acidobacteriota bacterium]|nr:PTS sugar transporter subunit IIA [Acidobacteriota bacterium]
MLTALAVEERLVFPNLRATTVEEALGEMASGIERAGVVAKAGDLARRLMERETISSTGLGGGLAIPHTKLRELADVVVSIGTSREGIDFRASDGHPVTVIFLVLSPADAPALHLQALARISRLIRIPGVADSLRQADDAADVAAIWRDAERHLAVPA